MNHRNKHNKRMRKILTWAIIGSAALGGMIGTLIGRFTPNWAPATVAGFILIGTSSIAYGVRTQKRRTEQLTLPSIPKQRNSRKDI